MRFGSKITNPFCSSFVGTKLPLYFFLADELEHFFLYRVTIGTWNVAGKPPDDDVEIDEWLCMKEPADIYILG